MEPVTVSPPSTVMAIKVSGPLVAGIRSIANRVSTNHRVCGPCWGAEFVEPFWVA
jgi:hypothetical protein